MKKPRVLILHANGTNRDQDVAYAFQLAGAQAEIVHLNQLRHKEKNWEDYQMSEEQNEEQMRNKRGTSEEQVRTPKECKALKNDKKSLIAASDESAKEPFI